ncbi:pentapeptide repeat protein, partial [Streptomyces sp. WM6372]
MARKEQQGQQGQQEQQGPRGRQGRRETVKAARLPEVRLPELSAWEGGGLEPDGDYDGLEFADLDLTGQEGIGARFMDCALRRCALDEAGLAKARILDSVLE